MRDRRAAARVVEALRAEAGGLRPLAARWSSTRAPAGGKALSVRLLASLLDQHQGELDYSALLTLREAKRRLQRKLPAADRLELASAFGAAFALPVQLPRLPDTGSDGQREEKDLSILRARRAWRAGKRHRSVRWVHLGEELPAWAARVPGNFFLQEVREPNFRGWPSGWYGCHLG